MDTWLCRQLDIDEQAADLLDGLHLDLAEPPRPDVIDLAAPYARRPGHRTEWSFSTARADTCRP